MAPSIAIARSGFEARPKHVSWSAGLRGGWNFRGLGRGDEDDGFAGDFDPDLVAEAEDSGFAGGGELDLHRGLGADLDLVEVARALEHAERDLPGDAWATRHRGLGHREGLGPQHQEPAIADAMG